MKIKKTDELDLMSLTYELMHHVCDHSLEVTGSDTPPQEPATGDNP